MKPTRSPPPRQLLLILLLVATMLITQHAAPTEARRSRPKIKSFKSAHKHLKNRGRHKAASHGAPVEPAAAPPPGGGSYPEGEPNVFDVLSYGAKGDGESDDSKALGAAWKAACEVPSSTLKIPAGLRFLIGPVTLQGPCAYDMVLQVDGAVVAPPTVGSWPRSSWFQWLNFKWVHNFTVRGAGTVDGQGSVWWTPSDHQVYNIQRKMKHAPDIKPTAVRFYSSSNVTVRDISIVNSPQCHLKFDSSNDVRVTNVTISSPDYSPNTDGIHLQNTRDAVIEHSNIGCGDDCVSIQTGCSNVHVHHINCGPGHGISLGGLGKDRSVACVSNITVENLSLQSTLYGLRIKTWQGGIGSVKNVSFSNVQVSDVKFPIAIDQYYCDKGHCKNESDAVAVSGIKFDRIVGTYASQPVYLACSHSVPCTDVDLIDVQLTPSPDFGGFRKALCYNSYGRSTAPLLPSSIDGCLRSESRFVKRTAQSHETICR